ncbi:enoyl-CoA hydratase/isomerase family protein [Sphingopyxis sp.]|uniref:enoyl-CoA hydratase/isomerase family protein n=1 Tax=Sphingopyxis sp. TaxID=1908224 RepID=UPI003D0A634E
MGFSSIRLTVSEGLARLTFIDAERGNPIDGPFCAEMCEAAIQLSENPDVRCVLITAEGPVFSYGADIGVFVDDLDGLPSNIKRWTTTLHSAIARLQRMDAPIVSAVYGVCAGGMSALVAGSDIVVAADNSLFVSAYAGIGYNCDAGASVMYTRRMGVGRARKFLLLNEKMDAATALAAGLADEVLPVDAFAARAEAIAQQLAAGPTKALGEMRRLLTSVTDQPLEAQLELEAQALARSAGTADAREGLTAFAEKRKPVFQGR